VEEQSHRFASHLQQKKGNTNDAIMTALKEVMHMCSKETLEEAIEAVCERLEEGEEVTAETVKEFITTSLSWQKTEELRQQEIDLSSFAVVVGSGLDAADKRTFQAVVGADDRGRGRACTGLMEVSSDVLAIVSTFLAWDKVELQHEWSFSVSRERRNRSLFSPCGNFILTSSWATRSSGDGLDQNLKLWAATSGKLVRVFEDINVHLSDYCFSPDGKTIVGIDSWESTLKLWNVESGTLSRTLEGHREEVLCVDVSPDGTHILSGSEDGTVRLWNLSMDANVAGGEFLECTLPITELCFCCSFSPNGAFILVGDCASLKLYDSTTHQLQHALTGHSDIVTSCSFAPDGACILSGSIDCTLKLWCTITGELLRTLYGHANLVTSCAFSPSGLTIVSGSDDTTLRLWTAATGRPQQIIDANSGFVSSCCFSSDGKSILSCHQDGFAKVWNAHRKCL
jgi:WD40 repeat protein